MGVNNKARREAKRRKLWHGGNARSSASANPASPRFGRSHVDRAEIRGLLLHTLGLLQIAPDLAAARAHQLFDSDLAEDAAAELANLLADLTATALRRNWTPIDLGEITRRRLSTRHLPLVAKLAAGSAAASPPDLANPAAFWAALEVGALLQGLPPIADVSPHRGAEAETGRESSPVLAKVRALLAKAESTEFPEEAEALSAKAQELIARHALDRHAAQLDTPEPDPGVTVRRLWLDAPYVDAKAMLVDAVADANHCRSVFSSRLGVVTLIGQPADVEATELLVTSLQVQADRAMLRAGRVDGRGPQSRTRSFRRSFLVSYATRIGERLHHTADDALATSTRSSELVPVLARSDERIRVVTEELFPQITTRRTRISSAQGWVAGRVAADLASFEIREQISDQEAG